MFAARRAETTQAGCGRASSRAANRAAGGSPPGSHRRSAAAACSHAQSARGGAAVHRRPRRLDAADLEGAGLAALHQRGQPPAMVRVGAHQGVEHRLSGLGLAAPVSGKAQQAGGHSARTCRRPRPIRRRPPRWSAWRCRRPPPMPGWRRPGPPAARAGRGRRPDAAVGSGGAGPRWPTSAGGERARQTAMPIGRGEDEVGLSGIRPAACRSIARFRVAESWATSIAHSRRFLISRPLARAFRRTGAYWAG